MDWIKSKYSLPEDLKPVMARNPFAEGISWLEGTNELGKRSWCHDCEWNHADDFVLEWRELTKDERNKIESGLIGKGIWKNIRKG